MNIGSPFNIENEPYTLVGKKTVAAKPVTKVTPVESKPAAEAAEPNETSPETVAQTKNNLVPTVIVLSIVIGCVAIVTIRKKLT